jgi:hypothetical protein
MIGIPNDSENPNLLIGILVIVVLMFALLCWGISSLVE